MSRIFGVFMLMNKDFLFKDKKIKIIRTAVGSLASVGFIRLLKERGFYVVGTDMLKESVGKFFVDSFYKVPKADNESSIIENYLSIAKKEKVKWIISGPEEEIIIFSKYKTVFESIGVYILHPDYDTLDIITDKYNAYTLFKEKGILFPKTELVVNIKNIIKNNPEDKLILKPRKGRGSKNIIVFNNFRNLRSIINKTKKNYQDYIVQEYVEGPEYTVDVLCDYFGSILNIIPRKRIKIDSGISVIGETIKNEELINISENILSIIKIVGGACFQFIRSNKTKLYYLTDINPRFGGGSILSLTSSKIFRENLENLLKFKWNRLSYNVYEFQKKRMYRYYDEIYR
jgi:carbamoyl-phosphate synthase large subunit